MGDGMDYPEGVSMNDVDEDQQDEEEDQQMDEPIDMDGMEQDEAQQDGEGMEGDQEAEAADESVIDPSLKNTSLSQEQKMVLTKGLGDWDAKFDNLLEQKNQDLEAALPAKKK